MPQELAGKDWNAEAAGTMTEEERERILLKSARLRPIDRRRTLSPLPRPATPAPVPAAAVPVPAAVPAAPMPEPQPASLIPEHTSTFRPSTVSSGCDISKGDCLIIHEPSTVDPAEGPRSYACPFVTVKSVNHDEGIVRMAVYGDTHFEWKTSRLENADGEEVFVGQTYLLTGTHLVN